MHYVSSRRFRIGIGKGNPSVMSSFSGSDEWNNRRCYGPKNCIKQQLVLPNPYMVSRIWSGGVTSGDGRRWTCVFPVNKTHKIKTNEECVKLEFPGAIVCCSEFQGCLSSDINGDDSVFGRVYVMA